jgi:hypothetical protein
MDLNFIKFLIYLFAAIFCVVCIALFETYEVIDNSHGQRTLLNIILSFISASLFHYSYGNYKIYSINNMISSSKVYVDNTMEGVVTSAVQDKKTKELRELEKDELVMAYRNLVNHLDKTRINQ